MPPSAETFDYEAVLEACARGEKAALRMLYEREARWLLAVAQRIVRDRELARDVLQDAFIQVWERASSYRRSRGSARGWVYTVVRHRALDEVRRTRREITVGDDFEAVADGALEASSVAAQLALPPGDVESLHRCLDALDEHKRECIVSAFVEGYTHEQIAVKLCTPVGTVKSWIRRGLLSLRECLS